MGAISAWDVPLRGDPVTRHDALELSVDRQMAELIVENSDRRTRRPALAARDG
jgi:hypothetical protein